MVTPFKLYGDSRSGNCLKVLWTAHYLGIECTWIETDIMAGATRSDAFLALNPFGQVPTAVFDGGDNPYSLTQSNAIVLHLAELARHPTFLPIASEARAQVYAWLFWEQNSHEPYVAGRRFRLSIKGLAPEEIDPEWLDRGKAALQRIEDSVCQTPYLVGDQLTAADIALVAYTRVAPEGGFSLSSYPALKDWIGRVERTLDLDPLPKG